MRKITSTQCYGVGNRMSEWYAFENGYPTRHDPGFRLTDGAALAHPAKRLNRVVDEGGGRGRGARV